jgi:hypothetical protein
VIDPIGVAGPRELEVANAALYNNWGEGTLSPNQAAGGVGRQTDPAFALRFGQVTAMYAAFAPGH